MRGFPFLLTSLAATALVLPVTALLAVRVWNMAVLPLWDPSEARYAVLAANMAETGDFVRPVFFHHDVRQTFAGKPPLAFQAGGLACRVLGRRAFAVRLPSLLSALGILVLLAWASRGMRASLLCLTSAGFYVFAGVCMTDMPLAFAVCGLLMVFFRYARRPSMGLALLGGAFAAAGVLVKGPVALALGGLPPLLWMMLNGRPAGMRWRHVVSAGLLFLLLTAPWFLLMERLEPGSLRYFFLNENLGRFLVQAYGDRYGSGHAFFYGVSVPWFLLLTLPWGLFLLRRGAWCDLRRNFPALATLCMVGFWALTPRVPLAYLLPAVPMAAWWLAERPRPAIRLWPVVALTFTVLLIAATLLLPRLKPGKFPYALYCSLPAGATLSFEGHAPYSAEFYLGARVRRDGTGVFRARRIDRRWVLDSNPSIL